VGEKYISFREEATLPMIRTMTGEGAKLHGGRDADRKSVSKKTVRNGSTPRI